MNTIFGRINELLNDPFFEARCLGREAIRQRTSPVNDYGEAPPNLRFVEWTAEDGRQTIRYAFRDTDIGRLLLAGTSKGLCFSGFACRGDAEIKADFARRFSGQPQEEGTDEFQLPAVEYCNGNRGLALPLHLKGTPFQVAVWRQLARIPHGRLSTYGSLAPNIGGAQAVGRAVGANPVSYIVPCHRIVRCDGSFDGYHWGTEVKKQLLAYEFQGD
ncbi:MAG: methylated-DNA--[protein]-cysteine S-methyltransferase [Rikenellaceae bacterium]|jgi:AraC family transcriptional regulator of adaptative response/methylated-DNA-[protein]-cysteine methyltransferase|nr:methylated-DNA--[protein]-cysteine S-methyltransferase [Rikenellaceae bacterium]